MTADNEELDALLIHAPKVRNCVYLATDKRVADDIAACIDRQTAAITALRTRVAELEQESFGLAAGQCIIGGGEGLTGDDGGTQYCAMKKRAELAESQLQQVKADAEHKVYMCCDLHMGLPWTTTTTIAHIPPATIVCPHCEAAAKIFDDLSRRNDGTA